MKSRLLLAQLLCASFLAASVAHAGLFPVFNTNDSGAGSLRKAILDAAPGDTIIFRIPTTDLGYDSASHIYKITLTTAELLIGSDLTIDGGGQKIIVLRSAGAPNFRIIRITGGNVVISGLQIGGGNNKFPGSDSLYGGGIRNGGGNLSVLNCILFNNDGFLTGGGIYNAAGTLLVDGCTFATNTAYYGGALRNSATARINNSTFYFNSTSTGGDGGAIYNDGALTVTNSTITSNTTVNRGGGMACDPATPAHVRNTIIAGNNRTSVETSYDVFGPFVSDGYNFIGIFNNQATGFGSSGSHDQVGTTGSPINPALRPADSYGGLTPTQAPMPGSPVIDQGSRGTNAIGQPINSDQRGSIRAFDFGGVANAVGGDGSDIGAVEVGPTQAGPTFTVTNTASHDDGFCSVDDCTLLEALNLSNAASDTNTINFAPNVFGTVILPTTNGFSIGHPLTLRGPGARNVLLDAGNNYRHFTIFAAGSVTISGLSFTRGSSPDPGFNGGAISASGGQLTLEDCAFSNNQAYNALGGGAIYNDSGNTLEITRCTFFNNSTDRAGGAIYNLGALTATNCTFSSNYAL
ncbi:MAG: choice-of-anchor Q domain-containing protein, partial [Chthoniobacterales bacterium]